MAKSLFPPIAALFTKADRAVRIIRPMALKMMTLANFKFRQPTRPRDHDGHRECVDKGHRGSCKGQGKHPVNVFWS